MFRRIIGIIVLLPSVLMAMPAMADTETVLAEMRSQCYDVYKPKYDAALELLPPIGAPTVDLAEIELPAAMQTQLGVTDEDLAGLAEAVQGISEMMAPYAKTAYQDLFQINLDVTNCYVEHLASEPDWQRAAEQLHIQAQAKYDAVSGYDFAQPIATTRSDTFTIAAHTTKTVRVQAYCLDSGRGIPTAGEKYYLAGSVADLQADGLCDTLRAADSNAAASQVQGEIWTANTALRASSELKPALTVTTPSVDQVSVSDVIEPNTADELSGTVTSTVFVQRAWPHAIPNVVAFTAVGLGMVLTIIGSMLLVMQRIPKAVSIAGIVIGVGLIIAGSSILVVKFATAETEPNTSLIDAQRASQVIVQATGTGSFTALDVTVTNLTDEALTLDTTCLRFIPATVSFDADLSSSYDNYDFTIDDITSGEVTIDELNEQYDEAEYDEGKNSQRLGTGEVISDDPPLEPLPPPEPEDTLDIEELKRKIKEQVDEAKKKFEENPTEETLRDLIEKEQRCQAIGCSDDSNFDGVDETWQKVVDKAIEDYNNDPSDLNRDALERAAEIGQAFGSNTDAAVDILVNNSTL